jgi:hypothetical protein
MKNILYSTFIAIFLIGCSSAKIVRDLSTDPPLRTLLDPTIPAEQYPALRAAVFRTGKFEIVERRDLEKIFSEQDLQFRTRYAERFDAREKWAHIGRLAGAASIMTASALCGQRKNWRGLFVNDCELYLTLIDARTGVVVLSIKGESEREWTGVGVNVADWTEVVNLFASEYPKYFKLRPNTPALEEYRDVSEELSKRETSKSQVGSTSKVSPEIRRDLEMMRRNAIKQYEENQ